MQCYGWGTAPEVWHNKSGTAPASLLDWGRLRAAQKYIRKEAFGKKKEHEDSRNICYTVLVYHPQLLAVSENLDFYLE